MYLASESSGKLTTDQIVFEGPGKLSSVLIITNGAVNTKVVLYDNNEASGTVLYEAETVAANLYGGRNWTFPVLFNKGLYLDITTTGGGCIVEKTVD